MEKPKTSIIWKTRYPRPIRSEIWDSHALLLHIRRTFFFVTFKLILGLLVLGTKVLGPIVCFCIVLYIELSLLRTAI